MKKLVRLGLVVVLVLSASLNNSCEKDKCGCDGAEKFKLTEEPGIIYYDEATKQVLWTSKYVNANFTICDPVSIWDQVVEFDSADEVLIWGSVKDDCMSQMNQGSSYYYVPSYVLIIERIELNEFGR